jgi:uncharacterized membrane protein
MLAGAVGGSFGSCGSFGWWWFGDVVVLLVGVALFCVVIVLSSFVSVLGCVVRGGGGLAMVGGYTAVDAVSCEEWFLNSL